MSTTPASSLVVKPSYSVPLAEVLVSNSLLQIQVIFRVLICTKNAYSSFSDLLLQNLLSTNFPTHPLLQPLPNMIWSLAVLLSLLLV